MVMAHERRYRVISVTLDEAVSFEEAQALLYALRMLRGVDQVHLVEPPPCPRALRKPCEPSLFEPG
jgi:hypothetical protein